MMEPHTASPAAAWLTRPRTILTFWLAYAFLSLNQSYVWEVVAQRDRSWLEPLAFTLSTAVVWASLTPFVIRLARWKRLDRHRWKRMLLWHAGAILLVALFDAAGEQAARAAIGLPFAFWSDYFRRLDLTAFYYTIIAGATHAADYHELYRRGELKAAELEVRLRTSQLEVLKSQMHPHFLFNTLNAVNALIHEDPYAADRMLTRLAELLRMSLTTGSAQEVTLAREVEFVRAYLEIQQTRLGGRLHVDIDVPAELATAAVPAFLLQPIVENAVLHGIAPSLRGGKVSLTARHVDDDLIVTILDDGAGLRAPTRLGIGLTNVRQRMEQLYGSSQSLTIERAAPRGTRAEIRLPYRVTAMAV